jgi:hypothetical protein
MLAMALVTLGAGLISGLAGMGSNPKEDAIKSLLSKLEDADFFKDTAFSKDELFNSIMPSIQQMQRGGADVAAGRVGASIGESDVAGGQAYFDYYLQSLAPIIAKGEGDAANTYKQFVELYNNMDVTRKGQFLQKMSLETNLMNGLPGMNETQKFMSNFMNGANLGATAYGNVAQGNALMKQGDLLSNLNTDRTTDRTNAFLVNFGDKIKDNKFIIPDIKLSLGGK